MKISTSKLNVTAVILTIAFGVFVFLVVRHQESMMKSGGCTTCGGSSQESSIEKVVQDITQMPVHSDDVSRAFTLASIRGLTVDQIRGGQL